MLNFTVSISALGSGVRWLAGGSPVPSAKPQLSEGVGPVRVLCETSQSSRPVAPSRAHPSEFWTLGGLMSGWKGWDSQEWDWDDQGAAGSGSGFWDQLEWSVRGKSARRGAEGGHKREGWENVSTIGGQTKGGHGLPLEERLFITREIVKRWNNQRAHPDPS